MKFLPLFFDLKQRPVLIVGGGEVAYRKARLLIEAHAIVTIISPKVSERLEELISENKGKINQDAYKGQALDSYALVVAATDDRTVNEDIADKAKSLQIPVNVVDQPEAGTFIFPAIIDRDPVIAAVSSGGASPVLARLLRTRLEALIPSGYGHLASLAERFRDKVKQRFSDINQRRSFWESVLNGKVANLVFAGKQNDAETLLQSQLDGATNEYASGEVYLVGAGPGDPDLLTFKALRLMQQADVVLYDRLVSEPILNLCRRDAELINVGKARSNHTVPQEGINQLLVDYAKKGHRVLRLKGGDPFIFGRGGEEIQELSGHGIDFQVVPGITAASGCASYAGIPLTHRDYAQSVRFVTGHLKNNSCDLPWAELAYKNQTIVFYMGLMGLPIICEQLIAHGMDKDTPIALVQQGTTHNQKVIVATLATMVDTIAKQAVQAPTLIIVGDVVKLHKRLSWFDPNHANL
ncbi:siroheme synthase CysG [Bermanella sp. R86510]|uniref:siroheme synthase CysG n=1 Tax=unclassified Bermanella TaxID=2627862 RepID=UPI0037CC0B9E